MELIKFEDFVKAIVRVLNTLRAYKSLEEAAKDFVWKVENGKARSVDSYGKFKKALGEVRSAKTS